jgi:hypothetical protein
VIANDGYLPDPPDPPRLAIGVVAGVTVELELPAGAELVCGRGRPTSIGHLAGRDTRRGAYDPWRRPWGETARVAHLGRPLRRRTVAHRRSRRPAPRPGAPRHVHAQPREEECDVPHGTAPVDAIDLEIQWQRLISIMDEVDNATVKTSFSTIVGESRDFACILVNADGVSLCQSSFSPPNFCVILPRTTR